MIDQLDQWLCDQWLCDQWLCARKSLSQAIATLTVQTQELPHAAPLLRTAIAHLHQQRAQLDQQIAALTKTQPSLSVRRELQKVPGIGPVTPASAL